MFYLTFHHKDIKLYFSPPLPDKDIKIFLKILMGLSDKINPSIQKFKEGLEYLDPPTRSSLRKTRAGSIYSVDTFQMIKMDPQDSWGKYAQGNRHLKSCQDRRVRMRINENTSWYRRSAKDEECFAPFECRCAFVRIEFSKCTFDPPKGNKGKTGRWWHERYGKITFESLVDIKENPLSVSFFHDQLSQYFRDLQPALNKLRIVSSHFNAALHES